MKRNTFIAATFFSALFPFTAFTKTIKKIMRNDKGFKVEAGKDRFNEVLSLFEGDTFFTKISTDDTDGDMYAFESTRIKKGGPPLHFHYAQDEWFYILSGEFIFKIGEENFTAKAGDSFFGPRMIPHAFAKINEGEAKMLIIFQPAGKMQLHFEAVSKGVYTKLSAKEKKIFRKENGFEVVGSALTHEK
jgi:mannose-6-phosphate isomerase-like protein (cupin superfamily)